MSLFCELFEGLSSFFEKFKNRNCLHLDFFKHKIEKLEKEIRGVGKKIMKLKEKIKHTDSDSSSEESDEDEEEKWRS